MRTILVTGASGDLAQEIVSLLPDDFFILVGRNQAKLTEIYKHHPHKAIYQVDISQPQAIAQVVEKILNQHQKIDILVNNAGYATYKEFDDFSAQEIQEMFAVNTFATMSFCRLIGQHMKKERSGHIVNIVSMSGFIATAKSSVYSSTKFAVMGFSNTIRLELAPYQVAVTTVNPGPIATKFFEQADATGTYLNSVKAFVLPVTVVAQKVVKAMKTRKREVNLPLALVLAHKWYTLFPNISDFLARRFFNYK